MTLYTTIKIFMVLYTTACSHLLVVYDTIPEWCRILHYATILTSYTTFVPKWRCIRLSRFAWCCIRQPLTLYTTFVPKSRCIRLSRFAWCCIRQHAVTYWSYMTPSLNDVVYYTMHPSCCRISFSVVVYLFQVLYTTACSHLLIVYHTTPEWCRILHHATILLSYIFFRVVYNTFPFLSEGDFLGHVNLTDHKTIPGLSMFYSDHAL